ncbi:MAG: class I SAM-dependent methyltransferase [Candidatus Binataceae bacterium]|nr:class I SAM-dependent methyltransferase [Candidatus Binataceae bacterium]
MNLAQRATWEDRHRDAVPGDPELSVTEMLPAICALHPHGLALDLAAGTGRNAIAVARAGLRVVAIDFSITATRTLAALARRERLPIYPIVADLAAPIPLRPASFDLILNVNYLDRDLIPQLVSAIRPGGLILFDTFLIDEAGHGHLRDARFTLEHYELRTLLAGLELLRYREGLTVYPTGQRAWRAMALARRGS